MTRKAKKNPTCECVVLLASGEALRAAADLPAAIAEFQRAATLNPNSEIARYALGSAWLEAGEAQRAIDILSKLCDPQSPFAERAATKIAEGEAMRGLKRSPPPYVRHLFDQFSPDYDRHMLGELSYSAHRILRGLADMVIAPKPCTLSVIDLGCGTGLAGECFKDVARRLDGVDLSPKMIAAARLRGIYDALSIADVEALGARKRPSYDLVVAADTLVYLGDLGPVFRGVATRLKRGSFFLFTVEAKAGTGYELGPKHRYHHSESYLRQEAANAGFDVMGLLACSPRAEANVPVAGFAAALQRN
jgi:predicted TPR repeat methyltransferase